jgi:hypothetical protein
MLLVTVTCQENAGWRDLPLEYVENLLDTSCELFYFFIIVLYVVVVTSLIQNQQHMVSHPCLIKDSK